MNTRARASFVLLPLLACLAGCGGGDEETDGEAAAVSGTFVGEVSQTDAVVAVVAAPVADGDDGGEVTVYLSDAGRIDEWLTGSATSNAFTATSDEGAAEATGELRDGAVTGTIELADGETVRYTATRATAAAGLYELTVSSDGELRGSSAAGVGLKGATTLPSPGPGTIELADGTELEFDLTTDTSVDPVDLEAGQVRLIVLPDGQLSGAGRSREGPDNRSESFVVRSAGK